ncbi:hypothetical protein C0J52_12132 [Blattella germanica]|nr:hypothetical protein C0J52_12132 [Blattella germanica]
MVYSLIYLNVDSVVIQHLIKKDQQQQQQEVGRSDPEDTEEARVGGGGDSSQDEGAGGSSGALPELEREDDDAGKKPEEAEKSKGEGESGGGGGGGGDDGGGGGEDKPKDDEGTTQLPALEPGENDTSNKDGCTDATSVTPPPPDLVAPTDIADNESSNSSNEDRPIISRKELAGTKRKAEVLSKESGKIGVTITTSSSSSGSSNAGSPPPSKLPKLLPVKSVTAPTSPTYSQPQQILGRRHSASSTRPVADTVPASLDEIPEAPEGLPSLGSKSSSPPPVLSPTSPRSSSVEKKTSAPALSPAISNLSQEQESTTPLGGNRTSEGETASAFVSASDTSLMNGHLNPYVHQNSDNNIIDVGNVEVDKPPPTLIPEVLTSPGSEYWHSRNPVADQVFITDVTVNLKTVTIRECKTEKGFFRNREVSNQNDIK